MHFSRSNLQKLRAQRAHERLPGEAFAHARLKVGIERLERAHPLLRSLLVTENMARTLGLPPATIFGWLHCNQAVREHVIPSEMSVFSLIRPILQASVQRRVEVRSWR